MMFGARTHSSPRASGPRAVISPEPSSAIIMASQFALSSPTEEERDISRESQPRAAQVVLFQKRPELANAPNRAEAEKGKRCQKFMLTQSFPSPASYLSLCLAIAFPLEHTPL